MAERDSSATVEDRTFRLAFEAMPMAACIVQRLSESGSPAQDWQYLAMNTAMQKLIGPDDTAGRSGRALGPDTHGQLAALLDRACLSDEPVTAEQAFGAQGTASRIEIAPLQDGGEGQLVVHVRPVTATDRGRTTAHLRSQMLPESFDEGYCTIEMIFDEHGQPVDYRFLEANAAFYEQTGLHEVVGKRMLAIEPKTGKQWLEIYGEVALSGVPRRFEKRSDVLGHWYDVFAFQVGAPELHRVGVLFHDIDDRKHTEAALRESEERLRQFGDASQDILWLRDPETLQLQYLTPAIEAIHGVKREDALKEENFARWLNVVLPDDRGHVEKALARLRRGEKATFDYRIRRADGSVRWLRDTDFPIKDGDGRVVLIGGIVHDLTEVREADRRLKTLIEGMPQLVWRALDGGQWTWASPQWEAFTGLSRDDSAGRGWLAALHPDDRDMAVRFWERAADTGALEIECRIHHAATGSYRWFQTRATPVRDTNGEIVEWLGTSTDVQDLKEMQERQRLLLAELQHRVRNLLGMVRSIVRQSAQQHETAEGYVAHLTGRIDAMARTQVLLTRAAGAQVDLEGLIRDELRASLAEQSQLSLSGPEVELSAKPAENLTMALHELATNAIKYGALGGGGTLAIEWRRTQRGGVTWLELDWREHCPQAATRPLRRGFGTELVEERIPYELKGEGRMIMTENGMTAHIAFPLTRSSSIFKSGPAR